MLYLLFKAHTLRTTLWQDALPHLSPERRAKVHRYRQDHDKNLSATAYLLLRWGLCVEYGLCEVPECFLDTHGKPMLTHKGIYFSLSHCHNAVICALTHDSVGADVEGWDSFPALLHESNTAQRVFSPHEWTRIQTADNAAQTACDIWVAKESVYKWRGHGIDDSLPHILHQTTDMRIDSYTFEDHAVSAAVCRGDIAHHTPLPQAPLLCQEISHHALDYFIAHGCIADF